MRNRRLEEILAEAGLINSDLARERDKGARDAANNAALLNAAGTVGNSLVGGAFKALDVYKGNVADEADAQKAQALADHVGDVGARAEGPATESGDVPYAQSPADIAKASTPKAQESTWIDHLVGSDSIRAKARAAAQSGIAGEVQANRDKAQAQQAKDNALAVEQTNADRAAGIEQQKVDATKAKPADELDRKYFDLIKAKEGHLIPDAWWEEHFPGVPKPKPPVAKPTSPMKALQQQKTELEIEALKKNLGKKDEGQQVPATVAQQWGDMSGIVDDARSLAKEVAPEDFQVENRAASLLPLQMRGDRQKALARKIDRFVQRAGKGLEGGKLAEGDIKRYRDMLVSAADDYDTFTSTAEEIAKEIEHQMAAEKKGLGGAGFAVERQATSGSGIGHQGDALPEPAAGW